MKFPFIFMPVHVSIVQTRAPRREIRQERRGSFDAEILFERQCELNKSRCNADFCVRIGMARTARTETMRFELSTIILAHT